VISAGIARLVSDYILDTDDSSSVDDYVNEAALEQPLRRQNDDNVRHTTGSRASNEEPPRSQKLSLPRRAVLNTLSQMGQSNYIIKATVAIETPQSTVCGRFKFVPAESTHTPALVKLDTGSDVDIVSQEFLLQAGVNESLLQPIPAEEAEVFAIIGGKEYKPDSKIRLFWYMEGEQRFRRNIFYVVTGAPVDLLLGSKKFASEAAKRVALFSRAPKSPGKRCLNNFLNPEFSLGLDERLYGVVLD
jgi:hypothetical protein